MLPYNSFKIQKKKIIKQKCYIGWSEILGVWSLLTVKTTNVIPK